jgi:hypothetical protein
MLTHAKTINLEHFYVEIKKLILTAKGYTELDHLPFLIKMCRLKPFALLFGDKSRRIALHRHWIDEFGNSVLISKKKKLEIHLNDLRIDRNNLSSSDLYGNLSLHKLASMSKLAFLLIGDEYCLISFLGIDDYLRTSIFIDGTWNVCSPLYLGLRVLRAMATAEVETFKEWKVKETILYPCGSDRAFLTSLPMPEALMRELPDNFLAYILENEINE